MAHVRLRDKRFLTLSVQYGVLSMRRSSSYLGRSSGRPFVSGPSPPHTTVSAATMACFLRIASIGPQRASGSLGPVSGPKLTSRLRPCLLYQAGFLFAGDRGRARPCTPQLRRLMLSPLSYAANLGNCNAWLALSWLSLTLSRARSP